MMRKHLLFFVLAVFGLVPLASFAGTTEVSNWEQFTTAIAGSADEIKLTQNIAAPDDTNGVIKMKGQLSQAQKILNLNGHELNLKENQLKLAWTGSDQVMFIKNGKLSSKRTIAIVADAYSEPGLQYSFRMEKVEATMQTPASYLFSAFEQNLSSVVMHDVTFKGAVLLSNIQSTTNVNLSKVTIDPDFVGATTSQEAKIYSGTEVRPLSEIVGLERGAMVKGEGGNPYGLDTDWNTVKAVRNATEDYQKKIVISEDPFRRYKTIFYFDLPGVNLEVKQDGEEMLTIAENAAYKLYELENGSYTYSASKAGYLTQTENFNIAGQKRDFFVNLHPMNYRISFTKNPSDLKLEVKQGGTAIDPASDGTYKLINGDYTWSASKEGYLSKNDQTFSVAGGDQTINVSLDANPKHLITFKVNPSDLTLEVKQGATVIDPKDPSKPYEYELTEGVNYTWKASKAGYTEKSGNYTVSRLAIPVDITLNKISSSSSSGGGSYGGGGGSSLRRDNCPNGDHSPSYYDGSCGDAPAPKVNVTTGSTTTDKGPTQDQKADTPKDELTQAYERAYQQRITTQNTIEKAQLQRGLTRAEMAKMMSVFAVNVLGKKVVKTDAVQYTDVEGMEGDLPGFIQLAYQLQIMGIDAKGNAIAHFNPQGEVSRAEFATVLSRVLFGDKYNQAGADFASKHLEALKTAKILKDTNPMMKELRGWVMLMLQRAEGVK